MQLNRRDNIILTVCTLLTVPFLLFRFVRDPVREWPPSTPEMRMIRDWIETNVPDKRWEVVQYWPPVDLKSVYERQIKATNDPEQRAKLVDQGPRRIAAIKIRTLTGHPEFLLFAFELTGGTIREIEYCDHVSKRDLIKTWESDGLNFHVFDYLNDESYNPQTDRRSPFYDTIGDIQRQIKE